MSVFRSDGNHIYLNIPYCEFYIPMYYFDSSRRYAQDLSDKIKVLGFFNVGIFENGKLKELRTLNLPTNIVINVYDSEMRDVQMSNGEVLQCKVVKYMKDSKIMQSMIFQDDTNAKNMLKFITSGNLPSIVPYSKALEVWRKNQELNDVHLGVSSCYLEIILSVMFRDPNNMSQKFSAIASNEGVGDYDYKMGSIRQICQYNSTFTALTYEDMDSMITTSLNKSREKIPERESPVEKIIKF